jgi:2-succinyl-6-hydroxy-2,4-cyclohexadiene-1-carboxylate synthase
VIRETAADTPGIETTVGRVAEVPGTHVSATTIDPAGWAIGAVGAGRPVVLLHGFTGSGASWSEHVDVLAKRFRVIVPDLPGHGRSATVDAARMSIERAADDLAGILERLDARPADVVGYSMGARVALRLAATHPGVVRSLILESPSAGIGDPAARAARRAADAKLADRLERDGIAGFVTGWEQQPVFASHASLQPDVAERQRRIRLANDPRALAASLRAAGQGSMEPLQARLPTLTSPTLVIAGRLDRIGLDRARRISDAIPGARLELIDGAGHTPHLERPDAFQRVVLAFLQEDPAA